MRSAISLRRAADRDSSRLATFAQVISSTTIDADSSTPSASRDGPTIFSRSGVTTAVDAAERRRMLALLARVNGVDLRARLLDRHAGLELADRLVDPHLRRRRDHARRRLQPHHAIRAGVNAIVRRTRTDARPAAAESLGQDRADRRLPAVDRHRSADDRRIAVELLAKHAMRQNDRRRIGRRRQRAEQRLRAA